MSKFTKHARSRMRQRGLREQDVEFIIQHGTETRDGFILSRKDAAAVECDAKRLIQLASRLTNKRVIADGDEVITIYHASKKQQHSLLHS